MKTAGEDPNRKSSGEVGWQNRGIVQLTATSGITDFEIAFMFIWFFFLRRISGSRKTAALVTDTWVHGYRGKAACLSNGSQSSDQASWCFHWFYPTARHLPATFTPLSATLETLWNQHLNCPDSMVLLPYWLSFIYVCTIYYIYMYIHAYVCVYMYTYM